MEEINPEIQRYLIGMQQALEEEQSRRINAENISRNNSSFNKDEGNLVEYQLDLKEELDRIFHLLSGHIVERKDGKEYWAEPNDDRLKIFSDNGVKQIMNIIQFYVNKNTLLSFYDAETINWKVRDFGNELNDLILCRYEVMLYFPSPEELYDKYSKIIMENKHKFPHMFKEDGSLDTHKLYWKCVSWSNDELSSKQAHIPMMILNIVDTVHSTYLRAFGGKERQSLREKLNINQNATQFGTQFSMPQQEKKSWWKP